jgi:hypothetical protein
LEDGDASDAESLGFSFPNKERLLFAFDFQLSTTFGVLTEANGYISAILVCSSLFVSALATLGLFK